MARPARAAGAVPAGVSRVLQEWEILLAPITLRTAFPHIDMPWPIGLQAIGAYLEDYTPIRFGALALAAQEMGAFARPPGYDEQ